MPCCAGQLVSAWTGSIGETAHPYRTRGEGEHTTPEPGLLALRRHSLVDTLSEPDVCLDVPRVEEDLEVRRELDVHHVNVGGALPSRLALGIEPGEPESGQDGSTLMADEKVVARPHLENLPLSTSRWRSTSSARSARRIVSKRHYWGNIMNVRTKTKNTTYRYRIPLLLYQSCIVTVRLALPEKVTYVPSMARPRIIRR